MSPSDVDRQLERNRKRLDRLLARSGEASDSPPAEASEELERALEELAERDAFRDEIERHLEAVVWLQELDPLRVLHASPAYEDVWGRPLAGLYEDPRQWIESIHPEDRERVETAFEQLLQGGDFDVEYRILRPDGEVRWIRDRGTAFKGARGKIDRAAGIADDVTERRAAREALRASEARARAVLDAALDGVIQIDELGTIRMVNAAACRMFGYEAGELLGQNVSVLMPSIHSERHDSYLERYRRTGEAHIIGSGRELEGQRKDGNRFPVHLSVGKVPGAEPSFVGAIQDLSDRRRLQRQLRAAATAASVAEDRERRRLAADLHDDVSQLLTLAGLKLGTLRDAAADPALQAQLREVGDLVARAHERGESLTFQLSPPILHDVGLGAAVEWLAEEMKANYGLRVRVERENEPPLDEAQRITLFRSLRELLINVARHARAEDARVRLIGEGDCIAVTVEDGGIGFDRSRIEAGYGLVSVRERVAALGGRFEVESEIGRGSRVHMTLPVSAGSSG